MGNCITSKSVLLHDNQDDTLGNDKAVEPPKISPAAMRSAVINEHEKKKRVSSFSDKNANARESCGKTKEGVVRIRVVVTQEELKQILSGDSCPKQLLTAIKSRKDSRFSQVPSTNNHGCEGMNNVAWKPGLESIPEEH